MDLGANWPIKAKHSIYLLLLNLSQDVSFFRRETKIDTSM